MAEVVLHCASGRVIGSLAIASRTRGAQRPGDRKLLLRLGGESQLARSGWNAGSAVGSLQPQGHLQAQEHSPNQVELAPAGKVAVALEADEPENCEDGNFSRVSSSSAASDASLRENSFEARHIINRTDGAFAEALACEVLPASLQLNSSLLGRLIAGSTLGAHCWAPHLFHQCHSPRQTRALTFVTLQRLSGAVVHDVRTAHTPEPAPTEALMLVTTGPRGWRVVCCDRAIDRVRNSVNAAGRESWLHPTTP